MKVVVPPIKSQGIKTKLVSFISESIPSDFDGVWVEPFMGTGVVGFNLAVKKAIMCDSNPHLIRFYKAIQSKEITSQIAKSYLILEGEKLLKKGDSHYYYIRDRFNEVGSSLDFLFLNRACFNGMIRFNRKGGFNVPFCRKPNRFAQAYVTKITNQIKEIERLLSEKDINFMCQDFREIIPLAKRGDLIYCDPPYIDRYSDYFNYWQEKDEYDLHNLLLNSQAKFLLSTWHYNKYRNNIYIDKLWVDFKISSHSHFYHVGASEKNRNYMVEALVSNK